MYSLNLFSLLQKKGGEDVEAESMLLRLFDSLTEWIILSIALFNAELFLQSETVKWMLFA